MILLRLLGTYLGRYKKALTAVILLTLVQVTCTLFLPTLNADIIDKGVLTGDTDYIWRTGGVMLVVTIIQVAFAIWAVYYGARVAMAFGRDVRSALFHRVTDFSAQDVASHGAPSLITRITNDVTQVQILVLMSCTLLVAAPFTIVGGVIFAVREDGPLSLLLLVSVPVLVICVGLVDHQDDPPVPGHAGAHRQDQRDAARADHRHPRRAGVRARARRGDALRRRQRRAHAHLPPRRPAHGVHVPDRDAGAEPVDRRRDLGRCRPHRRRRHAGWTR